MNPGIALSSGSDRSFHPQQSGDILYLTLDTPRCDVNIFSDAAACELIEILNSPEVRNAAAIVFRSSKPGSYINGAQRMFAASIQSESDVGLLTKNVRLAYDLVRSAPVPTICAVDGKCYGCGVEFSLCCDIRLAVDTCETEFRMTELESLILTVFEGSLRLPLLLGLENAIDFLLWGKTWSVQEAYRHGLITQIIQRERAEDEIHAFALNLAHTKTVWPKAEKARRAPPPDHLDTRLIAERASRRIAQLAPAYRKVYKACLALMMRATKSGFVSDADRQRELRDAGRAALRPGGKRALGYFFVERMAHETTVRSCRDASAPTALHLYHDDRPISRAFAQMWVNREIAGTALTSERYATDRNEEENQSRSPRLESSGSGSADVLTLVPASTHISQLAPLSFTVIATHTRRNDDRTPHAATRPHDTILHLPCTWWLENEHPEGVIEIAVGPKGDTHAATVLYRYLTKIGCKSVISNPDNDRALDQLVGAYFAPLIRYLTRDGSAETIALTMRRFGFLLAPHEVMAQFDHRRLVACLSQTMLRQSQHHENDPGFLTPDVIEAALNRLRTVDTDVSHAFYDRAIIDTLFLSLLRVGNSLVQGKTLRHPSIVDFILRELFAFPAAELSFCSYMSLKRIRAIVGRRAAFSAFASPQDIDYAYHFLAAQRPFYLSSSEHNTTKSGRPHVRG